MQFEEYGTIALGNVFTRLELTESERYGAIGEVLPFDPAILLVSHWTAEFIGDRRLHTAIVQMLAPGGADVLWEDMLAFDFRDTTSFRMIYVMPNLDYVGTGIYEFHVFLDVFGPIGEWGRACLTLD